jgi:hypothetical protein
MQKRKIIMKAVKAEGLRKAEKSTVLAQLSSAPQLSSAFRIPAHEEAANQGL